MILGGSHPTEVWLQQGDERDSGYRNPEFH
jgi:hypothetical protein